MRMFLEQNVTLGIFVVTMESVTTVLAYCEAISTDAQNLSRDVIQSGFCLISCKWRKKRKWKIPRKILKRMWKL